MSNPIFQIDQVSALAATYGFVSTLMLSFADTAASSIFSSYEKSRAKQSIAFTENLLGCLTKIAFLASLGTNFYQYKFLQKNHYFRSGNLLDPELHSALSMTACVGNALLAAVDGIAARCFSSYRCSKAQAMLYKTKNMVRLFIEVSGCAALGASLFAITNAFLHKSDPIFYGNTLEKYVGTGVFALNPDSPKGAALVFRTTDDPGNILAAPWCMESIRQLSEHRDIQIEAISSPYEICPIFEKASKIKPIQDVVIVAHGASDKILFKDHDLTSDTVSQTLSCLKKLPATGSIVLFSCSTGMHIGKVIADFVNRRVFAPLLPVSMASFGTDAANRLSVLFNIFFRGVF